MMMGAVPPSGGSLEIGNNMTVTPSLLKRICSPFGGIPRNWKLIDRFAERVAYLGVPPSGGSLEIGNDLYKTIYRSFY